MTEEGVWQDAHSSCAWCASSSRSSPAVPVVFEFDCARLLLFPSPFLPLCSRHPPFLSFVSPHLTSFSVLLLALPSKLFRKTSADGLSCALLVRDAPAGRWLCCVVRAGRSPHAAGTQAAQRRGGELVARPLPSFFLPPRIRWRLFLLPPKQSGRPRPGTQSRRREREAPQRRERERERGSTEPITAAQCRPRCPRVPSCLPSPSPLCSFFCFRLLCPSVFPVRAAREEECQERECNEEEHVRMVCSRLAVPCGMHCAVRPPLPSSPLLSALPLPRCDGGEEEEPAMPLAADPFSSVRQHGARGTIRMHSAQRPLLHARR
jgi:hypothetical protein